MSQLRLNMQIQVIWAFPFLVKTKNIALVFPASFMISQCKENHLILSNAPVCHPLQIFKDRQGPFALYFTGEEVGIIRLKLIVSQT